MPIARYVARRPRLISAERKLAACAILAAILAFILSGMNAFAMFVTGAVGIGMALRITAKNEDVFYELMAKSRIKSSPSSTGEYGNWYG